MWSIQLNYELNEENLELFCKRPHNVWSYDELYRVVRPFSRL
jgi:5-methylcytosine-specific restriction endonuclease McrA